jgi:hypothetical protein
MGKSMGDSRPKHIAQVRNKNDNKISDYQHENLKTKI